MCLCVRASPCMFMSVYLYMCVVEMVVVVVEVHACVRVSLCVCVRVSVCACVITHIDKEDDGSYLSAGD